MSSTDNPEVSSGADTNPRADTVLITDVANTYVQLPCWSDTDIDLSKSSKTKSSLSAPPFDSSLLHKGGSLK